MNQEVDMEKATERRGSSYSVAAVFCLGLFIAYLVRWIYLDATFVLDEIYYLEAIGLARLGRSSYWDYLLTLHGGYLHVLAKSQFYVLWRIFGLNPVPFRIAIAVAHSVSAACLFFVFRHYLANRLSSQQRPEIARDASESTPEDHSPAARHQAFVLAPWVVSLMWASLAVGGYDNVFLFIATGEQAMCMMWLTLAMVFVTQSRRYSIAAEVGMALCTLASALTWGLGLTMAPAIAVQYLLFERTDDPRKHVRWRWLGLWLFVVSAVVLVHLALRSTGDESSAVGMLNWNMPYRFLEQFAVSLGNMLGYMHQQAGNSTGIKLISAALLLLAAASTGSNARKLLAMFLVATMCYVAVLVVFRADRNLYDGRYLYVPSILWCVCVGLVVDGVHRVSPAWARWGVLLVTAIGGIAFLSHQRSVAFEARSQFDEYFTTTAEALDGYALLTDTLERHAEKTGFVLRIPQFPIVVPPTYFPMYFPYDAWIAASRSMPPSGLVIAAPGELTSDESQAAAQFLEQLELPQASEAARAIRTVGPEIRNLMWLSEFATEKGITVRLPDIMFEYPGMGLRFSLSQCVYSCFAAPLRSLQVVPEDSVGKVEFQELAALLGTSEDPEADAWKAFINRLDSP